MTERKSVTDKVESLGGDISDTVQDLIREAKPLLHQATEHMADRVSELTKQCGQASCKAVHKMEDAGHDLSDHAAHLIRHEPFKAMLIAAGIGAAMTAVIGLMARQRQHHSSH